MDEISQSERAFSIGERFVGGGHPAFVIAEIAQAHDGSLGAAHAYIDAVAASGADAIKFQTHFAAEESTLDEPFRVKFSFQDATRYDYWKRMEFSEDQWAGLARHASEKSVLFLSSPFSVKAARMLKRIGMPAWKIGSGELGSDELIAAMAENRSPFLISSGMSRFEDIERCVKRVRAEDLPFAVFQCASMYPTPLANVGLNVIDEIRRRFGCPSGLSDHSGSVFPGLAALARGSDLLEVHVTFDKRMFGPDAPASVTLDELRFLCEARKAFHHMDSNPVDKDKAAEQFLEIKSMFTKSLAPARPLSKGTVIEADMLTLKKPGTGMPAAEMEKITGRRLTRDVRPERLLRWEDIE